MGDPLYLSVLLSGPPRRVWASLTIYGDVNRADVKRLKRQINMLLKAFDEEPSRGGTPPVSAEEGR